MKILKEKRIGTHFYAVLQCAVMCQRSGNTISNIMHKRHNAPYSRCGNATLHRQDIGMCHSIFGLLVGRMKQSWWAWTKIENKINYAIYVRSNYTFRFPISRLGPFGTSSKSNCFFLYLGRFCDIFMDVCKVERGHSRNLNAVANSPD